jgi:hypothetical protein
MSELVLALFIIGVGLSVAGMGTHLYQGLSRQPAALRWDGASVLEGITNLFVSFICGPYIMLRMGFRPDGQGSVSSITALLGAFIAFGWSFFTGLMIMGTYIAVIRV